MVHTSHQALILPVLGIHWAASFRPGPHSLILGKCYSSVNLRHWVLEVHLLFPVSIGKWSIRPDYR